MSGGTSRSGGFWRGYATVVIAVALVFNMFATRLAVAQSQVILTAGRAPPRIYNALITSDQRLLPSQVDPIIMPVFRPFRYFYDWPVLSAPVQAPGQIPVQAPDQVPARAPVQPLSAESAAASSAAVEPNAPAADSETRDTAPVIVNNRPVGSRVPDVPPPPVPSAGGKKDKKKPEEYPPAPVGFAI